MNYKALMAILAVSIFSIIFTSVSASAATGPTSTQSNEAVVNEQTEFTLSGELSTDPNNQPISYKWEQMAGETVSFGSDSEQTITFTTPAVAPHETKDLRFALTVVNPQGRSSITSFTLHVIHVNHPPVVKAQEEITVMESNPVTLTATASDPDNDPMTYMWTQTSGDQVKLGTPTALASSFTAPALSSSEDNKTLQFTITADDGNGGTGSDTVTVHVLSASQYQIPTLSCNDIIRGHEGGTVTLSEMVDNPNNLPLTYEWTQVSGMPVSLSSANAANPSVSLPTGSGGSEIAFQVIVKQGDTIVGNCEQYVYAAEPEPGAAPIADAGPDQIVQGGTQVQLDGTKSTGLYLKYQWAQIGGEPVTLIGVNGPLPTFVAPDVPLGQEKQLVFSNTVSNAFGKDAAVVQITVVHPTAPPHAVIILK